MADIQVTHNKEMHRFEAEVEGKTAYLQYALRGNTISMDHTFTPDSLRGRGIASVVTKFALDYAKENKLQVIPGCSFVAEYIINHPEYKPLVK